MCLASRAIISFVVGCRGLHTYIQVYMCHCILGTGDLLRELIMKERDNY